MNTADDRTPAFRAAHDMTDPRNQLPTKAQRQAYSAERLAQAKRDLLERLNRTRPQTKRRPGWSVQAFVLGVISLLVMTLGLTAFITVIAFGG
jgi:hypothetical protein